MQSGQKRLDLNKTKLVGILNITPDSFSDGGEHYEPGKAVARGLVMFEQGADIIDIGGESSRPGSTPIEAEAELARIIPVIKGIREKNSENLISVDTYKAKVAREALANGADIINDISALRFDRDMTEVLLERSEVPVILMHMQGTPRNMQDNPVYEDVVDDILYFFEERINYCLDAGIAKERIIIDPGIGFGKTFKHNMEIFRRLPEFHSLGVPIMIGASRKQFIEKTYPYPASPGERLSGSLAITSLAYQHKIGLIRVHDVKEHFELLKTLQEIYAD
jgi:dihydropteroate synthase